MRLYLLRHAIAVPRGAGSARDDAKRPLTTEGLEQARQVAAGFARLKIAVDCIVTSPYTRAVQTAHALAKGLGFDAALGEMEALRAEAPPGEASLALKALAGKRHVVLVGHEPHLSAWVAELVAGPQGMRCLLKKGGVACIDVERVPPAAGSGTLRWLMTPKQLSLIGKP